MGLNPGGTHECKVLWYVACHGAFLRRAALRCAVSVQGFQDVARFHMLLAPDGGARAGAMCRAIIVGKKRLPDTHKHERFFGFVGMCICRAVAQPGRACSTPAHGITTLAGCSHCCVIPTPSGLHSGKV